MEMVISKLYNIFLEVELDKLSDRLIVRIERWKNKDSLRPDNESIN